MSKKTKKSVKKAVSHPIAGENTALSLEEETRLATFWQDKIKSAQKVYAPYYETVQKARSFYKSGTDTSGQGLGALSTDFGGNIFWSGIETQKPFLYFKQPYPCVERAEKNTSGAEEVACKILERALVWDLRQFDFDSVAKYARNDYLISGCGFIWETYEADFETVLLPDFETEVTLKKDEKVISKYVDPCNILMDTNHIGIFEEVTWIARLYYMSADEMQKNFKERGDEIAAISSDSTDEKIHQVYEIWDKQTRHVYWWTPSLSDKILKVQDDPLKLDGFFPIAKPCFASLTNDSLIPVPDFQIIEKMLQELQGITERMRLLMQALKVSGAFDASFARLRDIFDKDVTLVALPDFERLKEAGGLKGVIDFIPIEQYITALKLLADRRDTIKNEIFEITGVSDIMRGASLKTETATAIEKKTGFGTLRNQDRQNDMQRFILDCYRLKAELICEHFSADRLKSFVSAEDNVTEEMQEEAVWILKNQKLRNMVLNIETEAFYNQDKIAQKTVSAVETISRLLQSGLAVVSMEPNLLMLYKQMIKQVAKALPQTRQFESTLDSTFLTIQNELERVKQEETAVFSTLAQNLNTVRQQQEQERHKSFLNEQELLFKAKELAFKEKELSYKDKKAELDFQKELVRAQSEKEKSAVGSDDVLPIQKGSSLRGRWKMPMVFKRLFKR